MTIFHIEIRKLEESADEAIYSYCGDKQNLGRIRLDKHTGEVSLVAAAEGDTRGFFWARGARKLQTEWQAGRLPDSAWWVS